MEHADGYRGLVVFRRREFLLLRGRNRRVALDQFGEHAAQGLDTQRQRRYIQQEHLGLAA